MSTYWKRKLTFHKRFLFDLLRNIFKFQTLIVELYYNSLKCSNVNKKSKEILSTKDFQQCSTLITSASHIKIWWKYYIIAIVFRAWHLSIWFVKPLSYLNCHLGNVKILNLGWKNGSLVEKHWEHMTTFNFRTWALRSLP